MCLQEINEKERKWTWKCLWEREREREHIKKEAKEIIKIKVGKRGKAGRRERERGSSLSGSMHLVDDWVFFFYFAF